MEDYHFHHIAVYYDWLYSSGKVMDSSYCFLGDNYYHLSAISQYLKEVESLATALHRTTKRDSDDSLAA